MSPKSASSNVESALETVRFTKNDHLIYSKLSQMHVITFVSGQSVWDYARKNKIFFLFVLHPETADPTYKYEPFLVAAAANDIERLSSLYQNDSSVIHTREQFGLTALGVAVQFSEVGTVEYLLGIGMNASAKDNSGRNTFLLAAHGCLQGEPGFFLSTQGEFCFYVSARTRAFRKT